MFSWGAVFLLRIQRKGYIYPQPVFIAHGHLTAVCFYYSVGKRQTQSVCAVWDGAEAFEHRLVYPAAVVCNEGLGPLTEVADVGHKIYMSVRANLLLTTLAAVIGVFTVFVKFLTVGSVSLGFILLSMLLWALPAAAASLYVNTK